MEMFAGVAVRGAADPRKLTRDSRQVQL